MLRAYTPLIGSHLDRKHPIRRSESYRLRHYIASKQVTDPPKGGGQLMSVPQMDRNYLLTQDGINQAVTYISAGVYDLGYVQNGTFYVQGGGRSDDHLNRRLHDYEGQFKHFQYAYAPSAEQAFYMECELWHAYGGTNNPNRPARPAGTNLRCPLPSCPI